MSFKTCFLLLLYFLSVAPQSQLNLFLGNSCPLNDGKGFGICKLLTNCRSAQHELQNHQIPVTCSFQRTEPIVCCTDKLLETTTKFVPSETTTESTQQFLHVDKCLEYIGRYGALLNLPTIPPPPTPPIFQYLPSSTTMRTPATVRTPAAVRMPATTVRPATVRTPATTVRTTTVRTTTTPKYSSTTNSEYSTATDVYFVVGGTKAEEKQFPHMALIGYGDRNAIAWNCGGSLISENFVLTAAHCLHSLDQGEARYVKLGGLYLLGINDTTRPQQFDIIERIKHPDYLPPSQYNDIALLKLDRNVIITEFVSPACLNAANDIAYDLTATGWGTTEFGGSASEHLLFVDLKLYDHKSCNKSYSSLAGSKRLKYGIDDKTQLCAGGMGEEKDTCQGDSGGPLQIRQNVGTFNTYSIAGITSFGKACGIGTSPGVYTKVSAYIPWIQKVIW